MSISPSRSQQKKPRRATYWRRRFITLVIGLAVFAVIAWALSGSLGTGAATARTGSASSAAGHHGNSGIAAGSGTAATAGSGGAAPGGSGVAAAGGNATKAPATEAPAKATKAPAKAVSHPSAASSGRRQGKPPLCAPKEVVLSLQTSHASFGKHTVPQFQVNVVSTSAATCRFNVGARHIKLVIKAGQARIWNSADCASEPASLVTDLHRGIPTALPISWNRQKSTPGCTKAKSLVPAGTYSATAIDGTLASNTERIRLH
jgi:hypothetical protein